MKKGNLLNSMILKKNYIVMNLINIEHLQNQYHSLNNNEIMKKKHDKFNDNKEELYCNEVDKYLTPFESILLSE